MKKIFLVGNAHLDPVWQWQWQEGSMAAKATIRSALDRMKEFPEYKFVCSSASVYQWIEEFDPDMFEEIKERVKEGRFVVVGGWHVQPDCNLPSGEGFARQSLYAQRYFKEKLGVTAKVGYNVDSFGHNLMLPQILKKSGMDNYIFMRPGQHEKEMEANLFRWISPDGSEVLTYRISGYGYYFADQEDLQKTIDDVDGYADADVQEVPLFYGIGNHGGGPTIQNLKLLREYREAHPEREMIYSNLTDMFDEARSRGKSIPEHRDDLQHHASGCYSTVPQIKTGVRRSECNLIAAESYSVLAGKLCGKKVKTEKFEEAWQNICFLHFHDIFDGCAIKEAYEDAAYMYGMALNTAAVEENNALQSISWKIDTGDMSKGIPVVLFNPHGFDVEETVQINYHCSGVKDSEGNDVPCQRVYSTVAECFWRDDTIFTAKVPALGYAVYYLQEMTHFVGESYKSADMPGNDVVMVTVPDIYRTANEHRGILLENDIYRIEFEPHTGYIISFMDKRNNKELISGRSAVPVVIDEYYHDTWSHAKNFFTDEMARFADAEVTLEENGPVRATVKVVSHYNKSTLTQYFSLERGCDRLKVRAKVDWHEKYKMLKMAWHTNLEDTKALYEIPFGIIERPADGEEEPGQTWTAIKGVNGGMAILNDNTYSSSVKDNVIYQTILRSPIYGDHGGPRTEKSEFTAQGVTEFKYEVMQVTDSFVPVIRAARQLNKPVTNIVETWHPGPQAEHPGFLKELVYSGLHIDKDNIILSALKRSEDGKGLVTRLYEADGKITPVTVSGDILPVPLQATFTPYSVNTYYLEDGASQWKEVLLTEYEA